MKQMPKQKKIWRINRCRSLTSKADVCVMLVMAVSLCILALSVCITVGSPLHARYLLQLPQAFPSSWIIFVLGGGSYFLLGALLGTGVRFMRRRCFPDIDRGVMFLLWFIFFRLCWYPVFFGIIAPLFGCLILLAAFFFGICAFCALHRRIRLAWPILFFSLTWTFFLLWQNFCVFFLN